LGNSGEFIPLKPLPPIDTAAGGVKTGIFEIRFAVGQITGRFESII
jgi:hypothetical protein